MGVKFGTEEGTFGPLLRAKFHPNRCNMSPLRGEKPQNRPLSKLNTGRFALRAMLPVKNLLSCSSSSSSSREPDTVPFILCRTIMVYIVDCYTFGTVSRAHCTKRASPPVNDHCTNRHHGCIDSRPSDHYFRSVCWFVCMSVCLFVCLFVCFLCRVFLSRLWSDFDQTRTHVICLGLVVSPRIKRLCDHWGLGDP